MSFLFVCALNGVARISSQKYLICEDEQSSYEFGTTWGWVNIDTIFIFGWTIPLTNLNSIASWNMYLHISVCIPLIQCFLHTRVFLLPFWFFRLKAEHVHERSGLARHHRCACWRQAWLVNINYVPWRSPSCLMIGQKANKLSNKRIRLWQSLMNIN